MTRTRARSVVGPVAVALALSLSGCAAGFRAPTSQPYIPSNGTSFTVGTMDARNIMLVADPTRPGTFQVIGALVNNGGAPETLTGITVGGATVPLTPITVASHSIITTGSEPTSTIIVSDPKLSVGHFTDVTLTFGSQGAATRQVLAMTPEGTVSGG